MDQFINGFFPSFLRRRSFQVAAIMKMNLYSFGNKILDFPRIRIFISRSHAKLVLTFTVNFSLRAVFSVHFTCNFSTGAGNENSTKIDLPVSANIGQKEN